ncbi:hypothetical protein V6Z11_D01G172300 [Gossypium hirsutum]
MSILGPKASCISFKDSTCRCFGYMVSKKKYIYTIDDDCFALPNRREALIISFWPQTSLPRSTDLVKRFENLQVLTRAIRNAIAEYSVEPAKRITASIVGSEEVIQYISIVGYAGLSFESGEQRWQRRRIP